MNTKLNTALLLALLPVTSVTVAAEFKVYGQAHLSVDQLDNGEKSGLNVSSNSSRIGVTAGHKLDSGIEVIAQIETLVRLDEGGNGSNYFDARDTFLGLQGKYGLVRAGYFDTPMKKVRSRTDFFGDKIGDARNIVSGGGVSLDKRFRNSLHYQSPTIENLTFDLHYSSNDATGSTLENENDAISSSVTYNANGLMMILAYERQNQLADAQGNTPAASTGLRLGARYKVNDSWQVSALLQQSRNFSGGDRDAWGVGVAYTLETYEIAAQYYQAGNGSANNSRANMLALGVSKAMDKALSLYTAIAFTDNAEAAAFTVAAAGHGKRVNVAPGQDPVGLSIGAIYRF